jgi:hypothetical protein
VAVVWRAAAEHILRQLLPANVPVPTGFETVGHLAHVNLTREQAPFKFLIGKVYLDVSRSRRRRMPTAVLWAVHSLRRAVCAVVVVVVVAVALALWSAAASRSWRRRCRLS